MRLTLSGVWVVDAKRDYASAFREEQLDGSEANAAPAARDHDDLIRPLVPRQTISSQRPIAPALRSPRAASYADVKQGDDADNQQAIDGEGLRALCPELALDSETPGDTREAEQRICADASACLLGAASLPDSRSSQAAM
jgi:hypothetical protein